MELNVRTIAIAQDDTMDNGQRLKSLFLYGSLYPKLPFFFFF